MIHKENPGAQRPDPLVEEGVVDRDRQKLIREQDVLKEVGGACCLATVVSFQTCNATGCCHRNFHASCTRLVQFVYDPESLVVDATYMANL